MDKQYDLYQLMTNPRNPAEMGQMHFETYSSLAEAKAVAKKEFKGLHWVIYERKPVAKSSSLLD